MDIYITIGEREGKPVKVSAGQLEAMYLAGEFGDQKYQAAAYRLLMTAIRMNERSGFGNFTLDELFDEMDADMEHAVDTIRKKYARD